METVRLFEYEFTEPELAVVYLDALDFQEDAYGIGITHMWAVVRHTAPAVIATSEKWQVRQRLSSYFLQNPLANSRTALAALVDAVGCAAAAGASLETAAACRLWALKEIRSKAMPIIDEEATV